MGNPLRGGALRFATEPAVAPALVLALVAIFAAASLLRPNRKTEDAAPCISAFFNCGLGCLLFSGHTAAAFARDLAGAHALASAVFLGLAVVFLVRERSRGSTLFMP